MKNTRSRLLLSFLAILVLVLAWNGILANRATWSFLLAVVPVAPI